MRLQFPGTLPFRPAGPEMRSQLLNSLDRHRNGAAGFRNFIDVLDCPQALDDLGCFDEGDPRGRLRQNSIQGERNRTWFESDCRLAQL